MNVVDVSLLISELANEYEKCRRSGSLAGSDLLFRLAKLANSIFRNSSGDAALIGFLLASMFFELGQADDRNATGPDEAARRFALLDPAVAGMIAVLRRQRTDSGSLAITLVEAFNKATGSP